MRLNEYNRLVAMPETPARVKGDEGGKCTLEHPENTLIEAKFTKDTHKLDAAGRIPNCADLNAVVTCKGE